MLAGQDGVPEKWGGGKKIEKKNIYKKNKSKVSKAIPVTGREGS
jgi:hypothetical protein